MSVVERSMAAHGDVADDTARARGSNRALHIGFIATTCVFVAVYAGTFISLTRTWANTGTFEYCFLIFPLCAVLVWARRQALAQVTGSPRPLALVLALALGFMWLLGALAEINLAQHLAVVALCPVLIYVFYGPAVARVLAFPMGYVFFAVPFGNFMVGPLQDITAQLSVWALHLTDIPVFKTGRIILTPAAAWHVAEACSGVKFFIATTAFGVLYANIFFTSLSRRLIFIACAMVVPIIANGLRVFFTILIGEHFGVQYASGTDHAIFGWQFFGTVLVLLFFAGWPFHQPPKDLTVDAGRAAGRTMAPTRSRVIGVTLVALVVFALAPAWFGTARAIASGQSASPVPAWPQTLAGHHRSNAPVGVPDLGLRFVGAGQHETAYYRTGQGYARVDRIVYQDGPGEGRELLTVGNRIFNPKQWTIDRVTTSAAKTGAPELRQLVLSSRESGSHMQVQYGFRVRSRWESSSLAVKAWQALYGLAAMPASTEIVVIAAPVSDTSGDAVLDELGRAATQFVTQGGGGRE